MPVIDHPPMVMQAGVGQALVIELSAMPGAGMVWQPPAAPPGCSLSEQDMVQAGGPAGGQGAGQVGGPARQRFVLTCAKPGRLHLSFTYKRPWEAEVRAVQAVTVTVG